MNSRPNFLVFMPDQLRFDAVGCSGNPVARTPNIDALAARGVRCANAFGQHSVCSPSRVSIMTGWYPHTHGHRSLTHLLKPWDPNLLRLLRDSGYFVAHAGLRGDTFASGVTKDSTSRFGFAVRPKQLFGKSPYPIDHRFARAFYHGRRPGDGVVLDFDEATVRTAEEWLADGLPEPWMLYVPLIFPHPPFEVEEPWFGMHDRADMPQPAPPDLDDKPRYMGAIRALYQTERLDADDWREIAATYYGMVSRVDDQLGRVLRAVDRSGAENDTFTVFLTDHGEYLGDFGLVEKWSAGLSDCLVHNPLVIAGPGVREGGVAEAFVELVDLLPTLLERAEVEAQHGHFGRSLNGLLADPAVTHRDAAFSEGGFLVSEEPLMERAEFPYDLKAGLQHTDPALNGKAVSIRTERFTYVHRLYERNELYDRVDDPRETRNLSGLPEHAGLENALRDRILDWLLETADCIPWHPDPRFDAEGAVKARA